MQRRIEIAVQIGVSIVVGVLAASAAAPQGDAPPSLQQQLEAQFQLVIIKANTPVSGSVLVLQKEGLFGAPVSSNLLPTALYKDGVLRTPGADAAHLAKGIRPIPRGEKVYVGKIEVNLAADVIRFTIMGCSDCNGMILPSSAFRSGVGFAFPKGYLKTASVPEIEDTIAQVFDVSAPPAAPPASLPQPPGPEPEASGQGLTNNEIIKLVQAKFSDVLIIAKIKSSPCAFDTTTDGLIRLKQAGVSDPVLQAMVEAGNQPVIAPPAAPVSEPVVVPAQRDLTVEVEETLRAFLMAGNAGKYSDAENLCTSSMKVLVAKHGGINELLDKETKNGTIDRIDILSNKLGPRAGFHLRFKMYYKDGTSKDDSAEVTMEGGVFKINH